MLNPWFVSAVISLTVAILIKRISTSSKIYKNLPPSPPSFPVLGNLHQMGLYPHRSLQRLAQHHGPIMLLHFGSRRVVVVSSADAAREVMKTHDAVFSNRPKLNIAHKLLYQGRDVSTAPYGEYWRQMRSICVLQLLSAKRVLSFRSVREEETALLVHNIERHYVSNAMSFPVNLSEMFASLANDIICRVVFGKKYGGDESTGVNFRELLSELMRLLGSFCVGDYIPWLAWLNRVNGIDASVEKVAKAFDKFLDQVVDEHIIKNNYHNNACYINNNTKIKREEENVDGGIVKGDDDQDRKDFVDVLLEIQEGGFSMERDHLKAIILDMFSGGNDTTYAVLEWAMTELLRHPRILKKLQNETSQIAKGKPNISENDLDKMHYLKAVIKETLRLYPPIPLLVPRESNQDTKIKDFDIPGGTMVMTNAWAIGRDPTLWDQPEEFLPERFLDDSGVDFKGNDHHFGLIPFGAGRRGCPGILFAMTTNELVLANLVHQFDWSLPEGVKGEYLDMTERLGITIHRKVPLFAVASPRLLCY